MVEACGAFIFHPSGENSISAVGGMSHGVLVKIVDEQGRPCKSEEAGKLMIYSDRMISGYYDQEGYHKLEKGWLPTDDIVVRTQSGLVRTLGRSQDFIKTVEGERLEPIALESVILRDSRVKDALVLPFSECSGKEYVVVVVESTDNGDQIRTFIRDRILTELGQSALPQKIVVLPELPRSAHGKPQREILRNRFLKGCY